MQPGYILMRAIRPIELLVVCLAQLVLASFSGQMVVEGAYVNLNPVSGRPAAGYFEMINFGPDDRLIGTQSDEVERVEMHQTVRNGDIVRMRPKITAIASGSSLSFSPGGYHLMIFGVSPTSTTISITLIFEISGAQKIEFEVRSWAQRKEKMNN